MSVEELELSLESFLYMLWHRLQEGGTLDDRETEEEIWQAVVGTAIDAPKEIIDTLVQLLQAEVQEMKKAEAAITLTSSIEI